MSRHLMAHLIAVMAVAATAASCTGDETSAYTDIDTDGWAYGDTLAMRPPYTWTDGTNAEDTTSTMARADVSVVVRHNNNYRYQNLWLEMRYTGADSVHIDTLNIQLADEFGTWYGHGAGINYQLSQTVLSGVDIDMSAPIRISHIMRDDTLRDISRIGIVLKANGGE